MKQVIAISAKQGAGKTTLAQALIRELPNSTVIKFAQPLYDILKLIKVKTIESVLLNDLVETPHEFNVLYKTLFAKIHFYLGKYDIYTKLTEIHPNEQKVVLSTILKDYLSSVDLPNLSTDKITDEDGVFLQKIGSEFGRDLIDKDIWAKILWHKLEHTPHDYTIVDDLRFENEFNILTDALKIRLECDESVRKSRAAKWRNNTNHISEIGLDQFALDGMFDLYFNTEDKKVDDIVIEIKRLALNDY